MGQDSFDLAQIWDDLTFVLLSLTSKSLQQMSHCLGVSSSLVCVVIFSVELLRCDRHSLWLVQTGFPSLRRSILPLLTAMGVDFDITRF